MSVMKICNLIFFLDMERQEWYYDFGCSFEGVLCISLQDILDMDHFCRNLSNSFTFTFLMLMVIFVLKGHLPTALK